MHTKFVALFTLLCLLPVFQRGKGKVRIFSPSRCFTTASLRTVAEYPDTDGLVIIERPVEEGQSMQYECAWDGLPPYYYYKYSNMTGPKFLARSDLKYLTIDKIDHCYHDVFICCQSRSNESSLAAMKCHHMNVTCKCVFGWTISSYTILPPGSQWLAVSDLCIQATHVYAYNYTNFLWSVYIWPAVKW